MMVYFREKSDLRYQGIRMIGFDEKIMVYLVNIKILARIVGISRKDH